METMMIIEKFDLGVLYAQVAVLDADGDRTVNDWTERHVAQGFSWRPGCVSFGVLADGSRLRVEIRMGDEMVPRQDAKRAIVVPFSVGKSGLIEVGSIYPEKRVAISMGRYALMYETGPIDAETRWCWFTFVPDGAAEPQILRADQWLAPTYPLLMEAEPAWAP